MKRLLDISLLLLTVVLAGYASIVTAQKPAAAPPLPKIVGSGPGNYFLDEQGQRFFPWGLNYTNPEGVGLIDDQLHSESAWRIIEEDFAEMRLQSANTVRVHLQYHRFMHGPETPDTTAFSALRRLVDIAEKQRLYLLITGLGAYRKADTPDWYDQLTTRERWRSQALFWQTLADTVGDSDAVFAYDLMNEPVVSVCRDEDRPCDWLAGEAFGGFHFLQNISVEPDVSFRETMSAWISTLTAAIRSRDTRTLITVGNLGLVPLKYFEQDLDFISTHIYPQRGDLEDPIGLLRSVELSRPLVIEEIFNLRCTAEELAQFLDAIEGHYQGLIGHYFGRTAEELAECSESGEILTRDFLVLFAERNPSRQTTESPRH